MSVFPSTFYIHWVVDKLNLAVKLTSKENTKLTQMNIVQNIVGIESFAEQKYLCLILNQIIKTWYTMFITFICVQCKFYNCVYDFVIPQNGWQYNGFICYTSMSYSHKNTLNLHERVSNWKMFWCTVTLQWIFFQLRNYDSQLSVNFLFIATLQKLIL